MTEIEVRRIGRPKKGWDRAQGSTLVYLFLFNGADAFAEVSGWNRLYNRGFKIESQFIYFLR